ncbi:MAG: flotillin family protein, partial [Merismopedia sp. SIO2A8]|nr:flotillin family protein [Merismopedia sp. SIO2A8]
PEQVNEDKIAFAKSLLDEAEDDLEKLGLVLDTLKIQNISDDVRYLDSIGRKQQAELQRDARIAEAKANSESIIQTAENEKITAVRRLERDLGISKAEAERRIQDAITKRDAVVAEAEAKIAAELVRIQSEIPVQQERIKKVRQQLKADVVAPAEANCKRAIAQARGDAAQIIEDGKAQAEGTRSLAESWKAAGENARDIFLLQKLDTLMKTLTATVPEISVQNVTIVDTEQGGNAAKAASFVEQLRQITGIDLASTVNQLGGSSSNSVQALSDHQNGTAALPQSPSNSSVDAPLFPQWAEGTPFAESDAMDMESTVTATAEIDPGLRATVQTMLDRLALANPSPDQVNVLVHQSLQSQPELKQRLKRTLQAGGSAALKTVLQHPFITISSQMVEAWLADE